MLYPFKKEHIIFFKHLSVRKYLKKWIQEKQCKQWIQGINVDKNINKIYSNHKANYDYNE